MAVCERTCRTLLDCLEMTTFNNGASIVDSILIDMLSIYIKRGITDTIQKKQIVWRLYIV